MLCQSSFIRLLAILPLISICGCGWFEAEENDAISDPITDISSLDVSVPQAPAIPKAKLELNLKQGDRFPLLKTIEQTVSTKTGGPPTGRSKLELLLTVRVEEVQDTRMRLGIRYQRVSYFQEIAGETISYDSRNASRPIPTEAQLYHGLINNGFSFWLGRDNRILELVGFKEFLKRCVQDVPAEHRQAVMARLVETSGDNGIANFVDDSIGLLPYRNGDNSKGTVVAEGEQWIRRRQVLRPVPMYLDNRYKLTAINERTAEIQVTGTIGPWTTYAPSNEVRKDVHIAVKGGHSFGSCTIDRATGLPIKSRIQRYFDMLVQSRDGTVFEQNKTVVTTIQAFTQQGMTQAATPSGPRNATPAPSNAVHERSRLTSATAAGGRRR